MAGPDLMLFPIPVLAAKGAICFKCLKQSSKLNKCGSCKRVSYCSQACQKKDWTDHKKACKVYSQLNDLYSLEAFQTWSKYRSQTLMCINVFRSQRPQVKDYDERVILYQPYCAKCYRISAQLSTDDKLKLCQICNVAAYCISCSGSTHEHKCDRLLGVATAEKFAINHYHETGQATLQMPTEIPRSNYRPLSSANSWLDYYTLISDKTMVAGLLSPDLKPLAGNDEMACALTAASDNNGMILTIIAALEAVFPDPEKMERINLHIIGATSKELDALMLFEEMLHLLPALRTLKCTFVGPQLPKPIDGGAEMVLDCCPPCTNAKRTRSIKMFQGSYHDYLKEKEFDKPDLGVVFHSGHSQEAEEGWRPTIQHLVGAGHQTMFTTFNEKEMTEEIAGLKHMGARFVKEGERNKWMGMRPLLDPLEEEESSVYNNNQCWYIISGGKK